VLHGNTAIPLAFVAFDLLRVDGHNLTCNPWSQRRTLLEGVWVDRQCVRLADVFGDGEALFDAVRQLRAGGDRRDAPRRPRSVGLPGLGEGEEPVRRESEIELMQRRRETRGRQALHSGRPA
jgi:hypothetical protein